ncbi:MAG: hypothetical protein ACRDV3_00820, partial [Acidothermaceae bacterium]
LVRSPTRPQVDVVASAHPAKSTHEHGLPSSTSSPAGVERPATAPTVSDVHFADAKHGWLYGGTPFETDDGGASWTPLVHDLPGQVVGLAASGGSVWALITVPGPDASTVSVYRATYQGSNPVAQWTKVALPTGLTRPSTSCS